MGKNVPYTTPHSSKTSSVGPCFISVLVLPMSSFMSRATLTYWRKILGNLAPSRNISPNNCTKPNHTIAVLYLRGPTQTQLSAGAGDFIMQFFISSRSGKIWSKPDIFMCGPLPFNILPPEPAVNGMYVYLINIF